MLKKLIGLGLVAGVATVVGALAGGCSSTTISGADDSGPGTTGTVDGSKGGSTTDGTPPPGMDDGGTTCPNPVAMSDLPQGWKAPATADSTKCTPTDIANFKTALADQNGTDATLKASITNATCNACVFSKQTDANWTPLVDYDDGMGGTQLIINQGACFAGAPNGTPACGQAFFDIDNCLFGACPSDTCTDQNQCAMDAEGTGGTCSTEETALSSGCGSAFMALETTCIGNSQTLGDAIVLQIEALCGGGGASDAGGGG